ncbi:MAG: molecular chaperone TorD family protein [Alphaproteobacteria bacterium]|nr:molecular chaperone TorD family protein [Alphaproteobacteria bacterium]
MLANLLVRPTDGATLDRLRGLSSDDSPLGTALGRLAEAALSVDAAAVEDEYTALFYGQGQGGEILPYASYYLTGNLNDRPLARLRGDMERLGIAHGERNKEPEDHIGFLLEMMHGLITGRFDVGAVGLPEQRRFFDTHLGPWGEGFFEDLEAADSARLYATIATVGRVFMSIEKQAFQMAA